MRDFRATLRVPCANNRCMVVANGRERPSELVLITEDRYGRLLSEPFYRCERPACEYHHKPILLTASNMSRFVVEDYRDMPGRPRGERSGENVPEAMPR